ncbi:MAG: TIGR04255 family protein [Planctomycetes bacterium]|nr:TIGR04255 family protein [Planctomycetota bacterium]
MSSNPFEVQNAPIIEAVLDIDCDMPQALEAAGFEQTIKDAFQDRYPKFRRQLLQEQQVHLGGADRPPNFSVRYEVSSLQMLQSDEKQLIQVRANGYSFNRLAPYTSLDAYTNEIERTWKKFVSLASPTQVRVVRLRYINRIRIPSALSSLDIREYVRTAPSLPAEMELESTGFMTQHTAIDRSGHMVQIVLAKEPMQDDAHSIILDITVAREESTEPENWTWITSQIQSLRALKNNIFRLSLTERCLELLNS